MGARVTTEFDRDTWAVILGGSSGFGLATAHKLAEQGMNLCVVHRDRRGSMARIEPEFEKIRGTGASLLTFNLDALNPGKRDQVLDALASGSTVSPGQDRGPAPDLRSRGAVFADAVCSRRA